MLKTVIYQLICTDIQWMTLHLKLKLSSYLCIIIIRNLTQRLYTLWDIRGCMKPEVAWTISFCETEAFGFIYIRFDGYHILHQLVLSCRKIFPISNALLYRTTVSVWERYTSMLINSTSRRISLVPAVFSFKTVRLVFTNYDPV